MNRRRLLWLCGAVVLIGGVIVAWLLFANRDVDFHVIGPKTRGVRANLVMLDSKIDVADFQDCKTLGQTLTRLNQKLWSEHVDADIRAFWDEEHVYVDNRAFWEEGLVLTIAPVGFAPHSRSVTVKQFLRDAFRQAGVNDAHFIVRAYSIEATTPSRIQAERTRYLDSVSLFDRARNAWKELTGQVEDDVIEIEIARWEVK